MKFKLSNYERILYLVVDLCLLDLSFFVGFFSRFHTNNIFRNNFYLILFIFFNIGWLLIARIGDYRLENRRKTIFGIFIDFMKVWFFSFILSMAFISLIHQHYSALFIFKCYLFFLGMGGAARLFIASYLKNYRRRGYNFRRIIVVGVTEFSVEFVKEMIQHPEYGYKFLGFFEYRELPKQYDFEPSFKVLKFSMIYDFLLEYDIDEIYLSLPSRPDYRVKELIKFSHLNYIKVNFLNEFVHLLNRKTIHVELDYNGVTPIIAIKKEPLEVTTNKILKRLFDFVFASGVIVFILSWLYPLLALLIKSESKGPVIFKQQRTGMDNKSFYCYKFRTMYLNKISDSKQAEKNDPRITKIGAFLRKTNIDELPQFFNVLLGHMSVVGPRPHMLMHTRMYSKLIAPFTVRCWVKPGITGLAQAKGFRGETREVRQMYNRVRLDVFYIQHWSFRWDLAIVFQTIWSFITFSNTGL